MLEHDERYARADEWIEVVKGLWTSWDADAVVLDEARRVFADGGKVREIDFEGRWHRSRGPLTVPRPPQGTPVICQAGGSPAGRDLGARHADTIVAQVHGVEGMKEYRADVRRRMAALGRDPDTCKILFMVSPVLGETDEDAREKHERTLAAYRSNLDLNLSSLSYATGVDFAQFDLDAPFPELETNATKSSLALMRQVAGTRTLREAVSGDIRKGVDLVGTPEAVAAQMDEIHQEVGGDGFIVQGNAHRRHIAEISDGLAVALRRRGVIRDGYAHAHLRDTLLEF
jgi:alkanesulfonate monooxygenase SsuD/methylene tetrahydromethanopterin reductase-like flavin-dependent oxidoreductase (luciferase family)